MKRKAHQLSLATLATGLLFVLFCGMGPIGCTDTGHKVYNVLEMGAVPDGKTLNTAIVQKALDNAVQNKGTVIIPKGVFRTGSLKFGPHMTLYLEEGAVLLASEDMNDYTFDHFIYAPYADSLIIKGSGTIDGNNGAFFDEDWNYSKRPEPWIVIEDANDVSIEGIQLVNSPSHVLVFKYCTNVQVNQLHIKNHPNSPNTDGIDIVNCDNVNITNCVIKTGDDAICIKNDRKPERWLNSKGGQRPRITENVLAQDCYIESDDAALKLGTGSGYHTRNIIFEDMTIRKTRYAMALFMMDGGIYENITFKNIDAEIGGRHKRRFGIFADIHQRHEDSKVGTIKNVRFENVNLNLDGINYLSGHPKSSIENIVFKNVEFVIQNPLDNSKWQKPKGNKTIQHWSTTTDYANENASLIIAHAKDILFDNVSFENMDKTVRESVWTHDANPTFKEFKTQFMYDE